MRKNCESFEESITWYLDDELDAESSLELQAHLEECESCRQQLENGARLRSAVRNAVADVSAPEHLRARIDAMLEPEPKWRRLTQYAPLAAAAALILVVGTMSVQPSGDLSSSLTGRLSSSAIIKNPAVADFMMSKAEDAQMKFDLSARNAHALDGFLKTHLSRKAQEPRWGTLRSGSALEVEGARMMSLNNRDAVYIRYRVSEGDVDDYVSVFISGAVEETVADAMPVNTDEKEVFLGKLRGKRLARWEDRGLSYFVISDLQVADFESVLGLPAETIAP